MKRIILLGFFIAICWQSFSQINDLPINHIIITVDRSGFNPHEYENLVDTLSSFFNVKIDSGKNLFDDGDLLSMSYFCFGINDSPDKFISKYVFRNKSIDLLPCNEVDFKHIWSEVVNQKREVSIGYSLISVAKQFSLMKFRNSDVLTNRTFMIIVTDRKYNGQDFYHELGSMVADNVSSQIISQMRHQCDLVSKNYFLKLIRTSKMPDKSCYIDLYEYIPMQQYFSIESILSYQNPLFAKREKAHYSIPVELKKIDNLNFKLLKSKAELILGDGNDETTYGSFQFDLNHENLIGKFDIPANIATSNKLKIRIINWVHFKDSAYGMTVLHPFGSQLQGSNGLIRNINVIVEGKAKIFWLIPMPDFIFKITFWTDNQNIAAMSWTVIVSLLLIAGIIVLIYRLSVDRRAKTKF